jgi:hypothetical protein
VCITCAACSGWPAALRANAALPSKNALQPRGGFMLLQVFDGAGVCARREKRDVAAALGLDQTSWLIGALALGAVPGRSAPLVLPGCDALRDRGPCDVAARPDLYVP